MININQKALQRAAEVPVDEKRMNELIDAALKDEYNGSIEVGKVKDKS